MRPLIVCGMPVKRPPAGRLVHCRRNGRFFLEITAHPDYGLPFGQDRLVLIWVATLAIRQQSRIVRFDSAARLFEEFDLPVDGPHYRRMVEAFRRIFTSTIFFGIADGPANAVESARVHFFDSLDLWFSPAGMRAGDDNVLNAFIDNTVNGDYALGHFALLLVPMVILNVSFLIGLLKVPSLTADLFSGASSAGAGIASGLTGVVRGAFA